MARSRGAAGRLGLDAEVAVEVGLLQARLHGAEEAGRVSAVDDAVVVRQRQVDRRADGDGVDAVDGDDGRLLHDDARAEDGDLRQEHHGGVEQRAARARVREREGAARQLVRLQLVVAPARGEVGDVLGELGLEPPPALAAKLSAIIQSREFKGEL